MKGFLLSTVFNGSFKAFDTLNPELLIAIEWSENNMKLNKDK